MNDQSEAGGVGCLTVVFIVFLVLKLTGNIEWSWIWVFAPIWIPTAIVVFVIGVIFAVGGVITLVSGERGRWLR